MKQTRVQILETKVKELSITNNKLERENVKLKVLFQRHTTNINILQRKLRESARKEKRQALVEKTLKEELRKKTRRLEEWQYSQR